MGFWSGFAKGWQAEMDRQEKRRMFEEELKQKREATLLQLAPNYLKTWQENGGAGGSSSGGGGGGSKDTTGYSADHLSKILMEKYGVSIDKVDSLNELGGRALLDKAVLGLSEADWTTPELVNEFLDSAIVIARTSSPFEWDPFLAMAGMKLDDLSPMGQTALQLMTPSEAAQYDISFTKPVPEYLDPGKVGQMRNLIALDFEDALRYRLAVAKDAAAEGGTDAGLVEMGRLDEALKSLEEGNFFGAVSSVGGEVAYEIITGWLGNVPDSYDQAYYGNILDKIRREDWKDFDTPATTNVEDYPNPELTYDQPDTKVYPVPSAKAIQTLRDNKDNPEIVQYFESTFGPEALERYLNG
jgi:hypothetical protein